MAIVEDTPLDMDTVTFYCHALPISCPGRSRTTAAIRASAKERHPELPRRGLRDFVSTLEEAARRETGHLVGIVEFSTIDIPVRDGVSAPVNAADAAPTAFAIVHGSVAHTRHRPSANAFGYPVFCLRPPLSRLPSLAACGLAYNRRGALALYDSNHGARDSRSTCGRRNRRALLLAPSAHSTLTVFAGIPYNQNPWRTSSAG
ncbi:MAG TPA: DUF1365 family protein [Steroidobacteraceae bacterium]